MPKEVLAKTNSGPNSKVKKTMSGVLHKTQSSRPLLLNPSAFLALNYSNIVFLKDRVLLNTCGPLHPQRLGKLPNLVIYYILND